MWKSTGMTWMPSIPICVVSDIHHLSTLRAADPFGPAFLFGQKLDQMGLGDSLNYMGRTDNPGNNHQHGWKGGDAATDNRSAVINNINM